MEAPKELKFYAQYSYDPSMRSVFESTILRIVSNTLAKDIPELTLMLKSIDVHPRGSKDFIDFTIIQLEKLYYEFKEKTQANSILDNDKI